jgi:hypothetical protein
MNTDTDTDNTFHSRKLDPETARKKLLTEQRNSYKHQRSLEYILSATSYFDFFSHDAFFLVANAKQYADKFHLPFVHSDFLLSLIVTTSKKPIQKVLDQHEITRQSVLRRLATSTEYAPLFKGETLFKKLSRDKNFLDEMILSLESKVLNARSRYRDFIEFRFPNLAPYILRYGEVPYVPLHYDTFFLFDKVIENALTKFSSPIITVEHILFAMVEEKNTRAGKILHSLIKDEADYYLLRLKLMTIINSELVAMRNRLPEDIQFYGYLALRTNSQRVFHNVFMTRYCEPEALLARKKIVHSLARFKKELPEEIEKDILRERKARQIIRKYKYEENSSEEATEIEISDNE